MTTRKYLLGEFLEHADLKQFIIPEIQRDYVWPVKEVTGLLNTFQESWASDKAATDKPYIGFVYAYQIDKYFEGRYFLVDGQQRITTILLLLTAIYLRLPNDDYRKRITFEKYIRKQGVPRLDYKVRQTARDFLFDFIHHCGSNPSDFGFNIRNQAWYFDDYQYDTTVERLIENFDEICRWISANFDQQTGELGDFLEFVLKNVELNYFQVKNAREGEDFYLHMNSRGESLQEHENLKPQFLNRERERSKDWNIEKQKCGTTWEDWQDFFWQQTGTSLATDAAFNEFLGMVQFINKQKAGKQPDVDELKAKGNLNLEYMPSSIDELDRYFKAYKKISTCQMILNCAGVHYFFKREKHDDQWSFQPSKDFKDYFVILPILELVAHTDMQDEVAIFRFFRFFFNIVRKDKVNKNIRNYLPQALNLVQSFLGGNQSKQIDVCHFADLTEVSPVLIDLEEVVKLRLYQSPPEGYTREQLEALFFEGENHKILEGSVRLLLVAAGQLENWELPLRPDEYNIQAFESYWNAFRFVFDSQDDGKKAQALLLFGDTWVWKPTYYERFICNAWNTVVKDSGKAVNMLLAELEKQEHFDLDALTEDKAREFLRMFSSVQELKDWGKPKGFRDRMKVYVTVAYFCDKALIWRHPFHIVARCWEPQKGTTFFEDSFYYYQLKSDFRSNYEEIEYHISLVAKTSNFTEAVEMVLLKVNSGLQPN